jgi:hypothetical protein
MTWGSNIEKDTAQLSYAVELCKELYNVDPNTTASAIYLGDPANIQKLARELLAAPRQSKGYALINFLCVEMLARCGDQRRPPDPELLQLLRTQLSTDAFAARNRKKPLALMRAAQYDAVHPEAGVREIAKYAGINFNTVHEWRALGELRKTADELKRLATAGVDPEKAEEWETRYWETRYDESLRRTVAMRTEQLSGEKGLP